MVGREKLLIINKHQLGTLTDVYKWCYYLRDDYDITLLCFDTGIERVLIDGIRVKFCVVLLVEYSLV